MLGILGIHSKEMNKFNTFVKVISALAAVVGDVYIVATYGDKMVAWAKRLMGCDSTPIATFHYTADEVKKEEKPEEKPAEETAPETPAAEEKTEQAAPEAAPAAAEEVNEEAAPEAPAAEEGTPVANEEDFEG